MQISVLGSTATTLPPSVHPCEVASARESPKHIAQRPSTDGILGDAVTLSTPPPASPPPTPVSPLVPVAPTEVVVRLPAIPPVRPLRLACSVTATAESEESDDECEDQPSLPAVPDLPGVVASPGQDEGQPDRGRSPEESPAAPDEAPSTDPVRQDEGDGEELEISYYPEISERARDMVDQIHDTQAGAVFEAILLCGATLVLAAIEGFSATAPRATMAIKARRAGSSRCISSRRLGGDRQRYAAACDKRYGRACAAGRRGRSVGLSDITMAARTPR